MTELERLEVLAYVTKLQRSKPSYQDMSTEDRLAAAQALLQRWLDWTDEIDGSHDWRFPAHSERALTKLFKDTSSLIEQASSSLREG
jgi:hypothetical protein